MIHNVTSADVTLLLPGLLAGHRQPHELKEYQAISRVAAGASNSNVETANLESAVLNWFHGADAPVQNSAALLGYRLDYPQASIAPNCLRADPVFQQLDINEATLADRAVLDIQMNEAQAIIADLNRHFAEDDVTFSAVVPDRWYCNFPRPLSVQTITPGAATGRSVSLTMTKGEDAGVWRAWLAEIEMLLYSHPVNQQRVSAGKNAINSLWLWGEGDPHEMANPLSLKFDARVYTEHFYTLSLARYFDCECQSITDFSPDTALNNVLVVDERLSSAYATGDVTRYESILLQMERGLFAALLRACHLHPTLSISIWGGGDQWLSATAATVRGSWVSRLLDRVPVIGRRKDHGS